MASTTDAKTIIEKASLALSDVSATRWTVAELLGWLNDGQLEIATLVQNANTQTVSKVLVAGSKQSAPADSIRIIEFVRNMGAAGTTPGSAIRQVERSVMDRFVPTWSSDAADPVVVHAMYDAEDNNSVFYVWPPQTATPQYIELIYSAIPTIIPNATAGTKITIADYYANALLDYVLYRAFAKDSEYGNQNTQSQQHYQSMAQSIGIKLSADVNANGNQVAKK